MRMKAILLDEKDMQRALIRISHEIIEKNRGVNDVVLIGIKRRGFPIAKRLQKFIYNIEGKKLPVGSVDITLYRDDLSALDDQPVVKEKDLGIITKNKKVILVDDVIYTGRTARAAIDAVIDAGRPDMIQLAELIDRGHREIPIRPDYVGKNVPTSRGEMISVALKEVDNLDCVKIYELD